MPQVTCGTTHFDFQDWDGKAKVSTAEGSSIAIPAQDMLAFAAIFIRQQRAMLLDQQDWREVLIGEPLGKKRGR